MKIKFVAFITLLFISVCNADNTISTNNKLYSYEMYDEQKNTVAEICKSTTSVGHFFIIT